MNPNQFPRIDENFNPIDGSDKNKADNEVPKGRYLDEDEFIDDDEKKRIELQKVLLEAPKEGVAALLTKYDINNIRNAIAANEILEHFYEVSRDTLSQGDRELEIHRGLLINQLIKEFLKSEIANTPEGKAAFEELRTKIGHAIVGPVSRG